MTKDKPIVRFIGTPRFFDSGENPEAPVASVYAVDHPILGEDTIRTSVIVKKNEDGSFETRNTLYVPAKF